MHSHTYSVLNMWDKFLNSYVYFFHHKIDLICFNQDIPTKFFKQKINQICDWQIIISKWGLEKEHYVHLDILIWSSSILVLGTL